LPLEPTSLAPLHWLRPSSAPSPRAIAILLPATAALAAQLLALVAAYRCKVRPPTP